MTFTRCLLAATITLAGLSMAATAEAAAVFTLQNVTFDDGTSLTGTFTTDDDRSVVTGFDLATQDGIFTDIRNGTKVNVAGLVWRPNPAFGQTMDDGVDFYASASAQSRNLVLSFDLAANGLLTLNGFERVGITRRTITTGRVLAPAPATGAVPEPATWAMMLIGFSGMGFALRRREKVTTRIRFA